MRFFIFIILSSLSSALLGIAFASDFDDRDNFPQKKCEQDNCLIRNYYKSEDIQIFKLTSEQRKQMREQIKNQDLERKNKKKSDLKPKDSALK